MVVLLVTPCLSISVRAANGEPTTIVSVCRPMACSVCDSYFIKWSIKVCKDTSSVKMVWADVAPTPPYGPLVCVVEGLSFDSKNLAWEPPASQMMNRGSGNRSVMRS